MSKAKSKIALPKGDPEVKAKKSVLPKDNTEGNKVKPKINQTFTLKGINIARVNTTYGIDTGEDHGLSDTETDKPLTNTTRLTDLNPGRGTPETISFLDESKRLHTCYVSQIDFTSKMDINLLRYHCFWCRHPFDTRPIGCPIRYVTSQAEKKYHSHISRDTYTIKENVTAKRRKDLGTIPTAGNNSVELSVKLGEYYETDGVFCSFNCCQAWIDDNKHNRMYDMSAVLLMKMYNTMMGTKTVVIAPAPSWRVLEAYGGHLNILKFREGFNKIDYRSHGTTKPIPKFLPTGILFEENIKF
jgi:hypothetical protein